MFSQINRHRIIYAYITLTAAVAVGFLSFFRLGDISANLLILVAQFLLFALTMAGFGRLAEQIISLLRNGK